MSENQKRGKLVLIPAPLSEEVESGEVFVPAVQEAISQMQVFVCETPKIGRAILGRFDLGGRTIRDIEIVVVEKATTDKELDAFAKRIESGEMWGLVSDSGLPCIADPGAKLVARLRRTSKSDIVALPGPCSLMMALQLSGMPAQKFSMEGYPPKEERECLEMLRALEKRSTYEGSTHLWIERPFLCNPFLNKAIRTLSPTTIFAVVWEISGKDQGVKVLAVEEWQRLAARGELPDLHKKETVFMMRAELAPMRPSHRTGGRSR